MRLRMDRASNLPTGACFEQDYSKTRSPITALGRQSLDGMRIAVSSLRPRLCTKSELATKCEVAIQIFSGDPVHEGLWAEPRFGADPIEDVGEDAEARRGEPQHGDANEGREQRPPLAMNKEEN